MTSKEKKIDKEQETQKWDVQDTHEEKIRTIVVPGEVVGSSESFLPGEGTRKENKEIVASRYGLLEKEGKLAKVIPLSGAYIPRVGNIVIGQVIDINFNGWNVDILAPHEAFLPVTECYGFINKKDLTEHFNLNDIIVTKIRAVKSRSVELTMKEKGLKKLEEGMILKINPTRVPRIIGRSGSMVNTIKQETGCNIIVGQNGLIWIKGDKPTSEIAVKKAIEFIVEKPFEEGLTDKIKKFLQEQNKKIQK